MADTYTPIADYRLVGRACVVRAGPANDNLVTNAMDHLTRCFSASFNRPSNLPAFHLAACQGLATLLSCWNGFPTTRLLHLVRSQDENFEV
jgi:hypothetical protein